MKTSAICLLAVLCFGAASAHLCILDPPQRGGTTGSDKAGADVCFKQPDCAKDPKGEPAVTVVAGESASISWMKNLDHYYASAPGNFSVNAILTTGQKFPVYSTPDDNKPSLSTYKTSVTLPSFAPPGNYVIEVAYFTNNPNAPAVFYQCTDVKVTAPPASNLRTALVGATPAKVTDCSSPAAHTKMSSYTLTPNPPVKGKDVTLDFKGVMDEDVTGGDYNLQVTFSGLKVLDHTHSICGDDKISLPLGMGTINVKGLTCPQAKGGFELTEVIPVPSAAPSGEIKAHFTAKDENGDELLCMDVDMTL